MDHCSEIKPPTLHPTAFITAYDTNWPTAGLRHCNDTTFTHLQTEVLCDFEPLQQIMKQRHTRQIHQSGNQLRLMVLLVVASWIMTSCGAYRRSADQYQTVSYLIGDAAPLPFYTLFQHHDDSLTVYFSIPQRTSSTTQPTGAGYSLHLRLTTPGGSPTIHDSATYYIQPDTTQSSGGLLTGNVGVFTGEAGGRRILMVLTDLNTEVYHEHQCILPAAWPPAATHFLAESLTGMPLNASYMNTNDSFTLRSSIVTGQAVRVRYYENNYPVAYPPFANILPQHFDYSADSLFTISFTDGISAPLRLHRPGIYHLTTDTTLRVGFTLLVRDLPYPWISRPEQMVGPLRYISTLKEYREIESAANTREAVDAFWLAQTGNELRASRMIREYYRRVEKANYLFTSFQDGWKTDRGMIYIVYGPPSMVQRTHEAEIWTYGESRHLLSLTFVFIKMQNPFTDNDYVLDRNLNYKTGWHQMINSWRR
jgi:GWxTD domain-containing protein